MTLPYKINVIDLARPGTLQPDGTLAEDIVASDIAVRVEERMRRITDLNGNTTTADITIFAEPDLVIGTRDKVIYNGQTYEVIESMAKQNDVGVHHQEILGRLLR